MKRNRTADLLPLGVVLLAAGGFALRSALYVFAVDEKNLLLRHHPLSLALLVCTAAAAALALAAARQGYKVKSYAPNFDISLPAALGHILAGSGIALTVLLTPAPGIGPVALLWKGSGLLCCPMLLLAAFSRSRGDKPFFGTYGVVSIFFALHLVAHYQLWCSDPQLSNYLFSFLASICLMLFAYYQTAFCVDNGSSFLVRLTGLLAAFCCVTTLSAADAPYLYGGCALWALTGLSRTCPHTDKKAGDVHGSA